MRIERTHLADTLDVIRAQLAKMETEADGRGAAIENMGRQMREEERRMLESLWTADGFEEVVRFSQIMQSRTVTFAANRLANETSDALRNMLSVPYFARIDLTFDDEDDSEKIYIGRATLRDEQTHEILIHDWRASIASVFYRFGTGRVSFAAPGGKIEGEMTRKRQYEIKNGRLVYYFDADVQVQDEFLRVMLGRNASPRMRAIVETIQRDQDIAIRDTTHDLLIVQGAAGSGKTSVALHRAAYLMYAGLASPLKACDIRILSPNDLFERYIYGVLPELGETSAETTTYERLLESVIGTRVEPRSERFERMHAAGEDIGFLSSPAMVELLDRMIHALPRRWLMITDLCYAGRILFTRAELIAAIEREETLPLGARLHRLETAIWDAVFQKRTFRIKQLTAYARVNSRHAQELDACARAYSILECAQLARHIHAFTRPDARRLYARIMADECVVRKYGAGLDLPQNLSAILMRTREAIARDPLPIENAAAVAYIACALRHPGKPSGIRQVVVDEAQDYGALDYQVMNRLHPRARFTVLGDVNQALDRRVDLTLYDEIAHAMNRRTSALVRLDKSFRCTREILEFSLQFLDDSATIESFSRSGEVPAESFYRDTPDAKAQIEREIAALGVADMRTIALISETASAARGWAATLGIPFVELDGEVEMAGAFCIPIALSKGLEFDAVFVLDARRWTERRHLYVACTRALHRLRLFSHVEDGRERI